jgi:hypothetical protein
MPSIATARDRSHDISESASCHFIQASNCRSAQLPLAGARKVPNGPGLDPEEAAKLAIARRAKPRGPPGHVRLVLTLELRRALAEQLSAKAIRSGKNLEAIVIDMLEAGAKR